MGLRRLDELAHSPAFAIPRMLVRRLPWAIQGPLRRFRWRFVPHRLAYDRRELEAAAAVEYCVGRGIDVGCGSHKTHPDAIGVDLTKNAELGRFGSELGEPSAADIQASGDNLNMFETGSLDYVIARHNLEHYVDPVLALIEWRRVLKPSGRLVIVVPDERYLNTIAMDPTHKHAFTPESLGRLINILGGLKIDRLESCVPEWSVICVATRVASSTASR